MSSINDFGEFHVTAKDLASMLWFRIKQKLRLFHGKPKKDVFGGQCFHGSLRVKSATEHGVHGFYRYLLIIAECRGCGEEWRLQARNPGILSSRPTSNRYDDSDGKTIHDDGNTKALDAGGSARMLRDPGAEPDAASLSRGFVADPFNPQGARPKNKRLARNPSRRKAAQRRATGNRQRGPKR